MTRSAIQLYTLRNVDRPFTDVLELVADAGFDGVEFAYRVTDEDPEAVVETLDDTGLDVAGAHVPIDSLEDDFEETVAFYDELGVENVVIPWLDEENFESREAVQAAAERLAPIQEKLAEHGKSLHYHNHHHEFVPLGVEESDAAEGNQAETGDGPAETGAGGGETGFDAFVDATDCGIELDLGLALKGGDDVVARLRSLGERSRLVHLKGYDAETDEYAPVGEGSLDLSACADAIHDNDSEWLIYEYEGEDPLASLEEAAERTNEMCRRGD